MAEKIVSLSEINDLLMQGAGGGKKTASKLRKAFDASAQEEAVYLAMGETDEQCFFTTKNRPGKGLLSALFGKEAVYCTASAFANVVALSDLAPAAKEAALKAAAAAPDHAPEMAQGDFVPYPRFVGFSG